MIVVVSGASIKRSKVMSASMSISMSLCINESKEYEDPGVKRSSRAQVIRCATKVLEARAVVQNESDGILAERMVMLGAIET